MNKLNLSFIMSSYGDDLRCKDVHASASAEAVNIKVAGGKFNVPIAATKPSLSAGAGPPGVPGDLQFVIDSATAADNGVYMCTAGDGVASTSTWIVCAQKN